MAVPEISAPLTRATALVLRQRARTAVSNGATYSAVNASFALSPAGPYSAVLGNYAAITATVTGLTTGSYVARGVTPGQADQPWGTPLSVTTGTPGVFSNVPVLVGTGASIVVAPVGLESVCNWRSATFNVSPAVVLTSTPGVDSLDLKLNTTVNNAAAANIGVDWGDGTATQNGTVAFWTAGAGVTHHYVKAGTYAIKSAATTAGSAPAGTANLTVVVSGAVITAWSDTSVLNRGHAKVQVSPSVTWANVLVNWGDSSGQTVLPANIADIPHDYLNAGVYTLTATLDIGDTSRTTLSIPVTPSLMREAGDPEPDPGEGEPEDEPEDATEPKLAPKRNRSKAAK